MVGKAGRKLDVPGWLESSRGPLPRRNDVQDLAGTNADDKSSGALKVQIRP